MRIRPGTVLAEREWSTLDDTELNIPASGKLTHLQFRRFAGCPVCNVHLQSVARRHDEIIAAGIQEVALFHSPTAELRPHAADLPFAVVADPDKKHYGEFGVEAGRRALLDPRAWGPILQAIARTLPSVLRKRQPTPAANPRGGRFGLPADFLIDSDGQVLACNYGAHLNDHWSVDELLRLARGRHAPAID